MSIKYFQKNKNNDEDYNSCGLFWVPKRIYLDCEGRLNFISKDSMFYITLNLLFLQH